MTTSSDSPVPLTDVSQRLDGVDVLRGLAVILVVLHHIHIRFQIRGYEVANLLPEAVGKVLFWSGYYAVIAFFVISGFLITRPSLQRWESLRQIRILEFYHLRASRILPCLVLLVAVLSSLHLAGISDFVIKPARASLPKAVLAAFTFHINWLEGHRGYLPGNWDVLWSLSVEETFYLLFPIVCLLLKRPALLLVALLALIVTGPFNRMALEGHQPWDDYAYLSCMDGIALGCIAGWISIRVRLSPSAARAALIVGTVAVCLITVFRTQTFDLGLTRVGLNVTVLEIGVALVLIAFARGVGGAFFSRNLHLLRGVGRCSYEIYLTHMFVVLGLMHPIRSLFGVRDLHPAVYFVSYLAMLMLSVVLGYVTARWFSEPMNRILRKRMRQRTSIAAPGPAHAEQLS